MVYCAVVRYCYKYLISFQFWRGRGGGGGGILASLYDISGGGY